MKALQTAVQTERLSSSQGVLQKMFAVWFDAFVYNQIWEDPRVDIQALKLDENSRVLTISSGGCNALNYLLENPESVTAVLNFLRMTSGGSTIRTMPCSAPRVVDIRRSGSCRFLIRAPTSG